MPVPLHTAHSSARVARRRVVRGLPLPLRLLAGGAALGYLGGKALDSREEKRMGSLEQLVELHRRISRVS